MSVFAVDESGELVREGGAYVRIDGVEEILQGVRTRMRLIRGEVLLDVLAGARYVGLALAKGTPLQRIEAEVAEQALLVPGVVSVDRVLVTPDYANRHAVVEIDMTASIADLRRRVPVSDRFTLRTE